MDIKANPLISVITPFYNASNTLSYALRSLLVQSYQNWECILVDDGSEDNPQAVISQFNDPRISYHRLDTNQGRGAARQYGLDQAKGDYLCMLDADDWIYPHKLQTQLDVMERHQKLGLISSGMAVVDERNKLIGVQGINDSEKTLLKYKRMTKASPPIIPFAPAMIRMHAAREAEFDPNLQRSEDADFLMQILLKHEYGLMTNIYYVYRKIDNNSKEDVLAGYMSRMQVFKKYRLKYPFYSNVHILLTMIKWLIYWIAFGLGLGEELIKKRSRLPTESERIDYQRALKQLETHSLDY